MAEETRRQWYDVFGHLNYRATNPVFKQSSEVVELKPEERVGENMPSRCRDQGGDLRGYGPEPICAVVELEPGMFVVANHIDVCRDAVMQEFRRDINAFRYGEPFALHLPGFEPGQYASFHHLNVAGVKSKNTLAVMADVGAVVNHLTERATPGKPVTLDTIEEALHLITYPSPYDTGVLYHEYVLGRGAVFEGAFSGGSG